MCRLLGIVAAEPYEFRLVLRDAPRSMAVLSNAHSDGWGLATHLAEPGSSWQVHRSTRCACEDGAFLRLASEARGRILVSHVRQKSVGPIAIDNTHPFVRGPWIFAHNGTLEDLGWLRDNASGSRLSELQGSTDSELFFAWLLTRLDDAGASSEPGASSRIDAALRSAMHDALARPRFGSINFLLSQGSVLWAHRFGRDLYLLDRTGSASCDSAGALGCPACGAERRRCVAVASEPITAEPWEPIAPGTLLRIDLAGLPKWSVVA